ncbi:MAG TPA: GNAT family protein [Ktedonobacterales bacterium]|nr:GNAT family protein [Ktedonobacterales bacterium]
MSFRLEPMRWGDARQISRWRYEGVYAFYDQDTLPLLLVALVRAPLRMVGFEAFVVYDDARKPGDRRIGIFTFIRRGDSIEIGLAMRPDLTGRGLGLAFVEAGMDFARARYAPTRFTLDVATFNERARKVYERAGFRPAETFIRSARGGPREFLAMNCPA